MLPPPTTIATSTPRRWTAATSWAIAWIRIGSAPYSRSPISASPESFSSTRRYAGAAAREGSCCAVSATDLEPREPADHHVLSGFRRERLAELLDRLAGVLVLVDVLLAHEHHVLEPLLELACDDLLADVLGPVRGLLGRHPLFALAVLRGDVPIGDGQRRRCGDV